MIRRSPSRSTKKFDQIVNTATGLFSRFGFQRVTVEEICRKAGASKMTFYKYFPNKIELLRHIWSGWIEEGYRKLDQIDRLDIPFPDKMQRVIDFKMEMLGRWSPDLIEEIVQADPKMDEFFEEMRVKNITRFLKFIEQAQDRGEIRRMRPEFILAAAGKLRELMETRELRSLYGSDLDFIREIHDFFFFGILSPQPQPEHES